MIPLFKPYMSPTVGDAVLKTLHSGMIAEGPRVEEFEKELAESLGIPRPLCVNSGTSAIWLALDLAGVGPGDYVVSTPMTCTATNIPILQRGAKILWADVDPITGNIDPESVEFWLKSSKGRRVKAVVTVDYGGVPVLYDQIRNLLYIHGVNKWISDAAHSFGATYQGESVANWPDFTCFSFQAIKHLTTGDGGALVCQRWEDHDEGKLKRWFGLDRPQGGFRCEQLINNLGYKFQMNDIAATIGLENLKGLETVLRCHRTNAAFYLEQLRGVDGVGLPTFPEDSEPAWWLFTLSVRNRLDFIPRMAKQGVQCARAHARNDVHPIFLANSISDDPLFGVGAFDEHQVQIPVGWWVGATERQRIVDAVKESVR
jgi:dTDP-4-amino-4,6-dideoxygalactose transaminase